MANNHCVRTTHAEQNAVIQCALHGVSSNNATVYSTASPCLICAKILVNAGIKRVVFKEKYGEKEALELFDAAGVEVNYIEPQIAPETTSPNTAVKP